MLESCQTVLSQGVGVRCRADGTGVMVHRGTVQGGRPLCGDEGGRAVEPAPDRVQTDSRRIAWVLAEDPVGNIAEKSGGPCGALYPEQLDGADALLRRRGFEHR